MVITSCYNLLLTSLNPLINRLSNNNILKKTPLRN